MFSWCKTQIRHQERGVSSESTLFVLSTATWQLLKLHRHPFYWKWTCPKIPNGINKLRTFSSLEFTIRLANPSMSIHTVRLRFFTQQVTGQKKSNSFLFLITMKKSTTRLCIWRYPNIYCNFIIIGQFDWQDRCLEFDCIVNRISVLLGWPFFLSNFFTFIDQDLEWPK